MLKSFVNFFQQLFVAHWRSLLSLLIGVYLPLQIFGLLALDLRQNEGGFSWDLPILVAIHTTSQAYLDTFAVTLTKFGSFPVVLFLVCVIGPIFLLMRRWRSLTYLLITILGSSFITRTLKELMHRVRPQLWDSLSPELDYAFPSGHATASMALVAALVVLTWGSAWCWFILIFGSLFVLAIAWTRLYLGVHFPSDILAGWMVSVAWAVGVGLILKPHLMNSYAMNESQAVNETTLNPEKELL
jgi:undecaprenyl-diphosphatase